MDTRRIHFGRWALASALSLSPPPAGAADGSDLVVTVEPAKRTYLVGEWVDLRVTKCNPTDQPITLTFFCPCCHDGLSVVDAGDAAVSEAGLGCILPVIDVVWEPGECKSDRFFWYQRAPEFATGDQVPAGTYRFRHVFQFPSFVTTTLSPEIVVDADLEPRTAAFIDFEALTGGTPVPADSVGAWYLSWNVAFSEAGYGERQPGFARNGPDGGFAAVGVTRYPPGFNIVADFALPVGFVAADVMTAAGEFVTMSAYDSERRLLAVARSEASPERWKGRLSVRSPAGIARVEWFPSRPQAAVGIDNLELLPLSVVEVPALDAAATAVLAVLVLLAGWAILVRRAG